MKVLQPQILCRLRMGLGGIPRMPHYGAFRRDWPPSLPTEETVVFAFSMVVPKGYNSRAMLFQKDCLHAFHIVEEIAGPKQS